MPLNRLHLVGGFLGSGKTTAIIQAAKALMAGGQRVGVITNDQGKYLVDTAFFRLSDLPAVEVGGGCFCCNYDDLNARLDDLLQAAHPDVVFAESVGSCADIVATVVKPLLDLRGSGLKPESFSVFADARLLLRRLRGDEMPFSEDVVYIYDQQIEEAGLIVANKIDLLDELTRGVLARLIERRYPEKPVIYQSSLTLAGVADWLQTLADGRAAPPESVLQMDYQRYAAGEAGLAWIDQEIVLQVPRDAGKAVVAEMVRRVTGALANHAAGIGHLKFIVKAGAAVGKLSFPTLEEPDWEESIPVLPGSRVEVLVNARAELPAGLLSDILRQALEQPGVQAVFLAGQAFHPAEPRPTHRYTG